MKLEIRNLKGLRFENESGTAGCEFTGGYALYLEGKGYLSFKDSNVKKHGIKVPYSPQSKKALDILIKDSGLINYEYIEWLTPVNV